jgi:hypothetical protein
VNTSLSGAGAARADEEGIILPIAPPAKGSRDNPFITFLLFIFLKYYVFI